MSVADVSAPATGVVQPDSYRETPVIAIAGGVVRSVRAEAGQTVAAGETVAVIFSDEFASAQSRYLTLLTERDNARRNVERTQRLVRINPTGSAEFDEAERKMKSANAALDEMRRRFERTEKLVRIGAASREELEQDTTRLRTAEAEVAEARSRLERSRRVLAINPESRDRNEEAQNRLRAAETDLAAARQRLLLFGMSPSRIDSLRSVSQISAEIAVASPVAGTVTARSANQGEIVEANKELLRVTNLSGVWVVAQAFERDLGRLRPGTGATVTSDAFPDRVFRGTVTYIDPRLDETTRTAQVRIELGNPGGALKFGMYVRVAFGALGEAEKTMPAVPSAAVQSVDNRQAVFLATADPNVFELRPVRLGPEKDGRFPVIEGLNVGDRVVTDGSFLLRAEWIKQRK
jgi:multidrug efflux pump subunit AcrA (membrane-fusion protein)